MQLRPDYKKYVPIAMKVADFVSGVFVLATIALAARLSPVNTMLFTIAGAYLLNIRSRPAPHKFIFRIQNEFIIPPDMDLDGEELAERVTTRHRIGRDGDDY